MAMDNSHNLYSHDDVTFGDSPRVRVFISHRNFDKQLAIAVANLFDGWGVHYWFDRDDEDTQRAAALGIAGDQALVHAIERGVQHSTQVLGLLSENTRGSWWVPYEIGFSRALNKPVSFLVQKDIREMGVLPEYVRLAANYWSVDELVRWAVSLFRPEIVKAPAAPVAEHLIKQVGQFVPRLPPTATPSELSTRALAAIDQLAKYETWEGLQLTSKQFDWLPTRGGLVRDLAYDLLAPLAYFRLHERRPAYPERDLLQLCYLSITQHYELAEQPPRLTYHPEDEGWRQRRYRTPASSWLQGMTSEQLGERLDRFFFVPDLNHNTRLATKEEFKAEFDRILRSTDAHERRRLGVLVNPLFGFTLTDRPVYWRVLTSQKRLYEAIVNQTS